MNVQVSYIFAVLLLLLGGCSVLNGDEWVYEKTPIPSERGNKPLVIVVGNSLAAGWQACNPNPCEGVETHWWQHAIGDEAFVLNRGIGNSTSGDLLDRWARDTKGADIVVILIGINDVYRVENPVQTVTQNLQTMHQRALDAGSVPIIATLPPFNDDSQPERYNALRAINDFIRSQKEWLVLDLFTALEDPTNPLHAREDEMATQLHPNTKGYARMGSYVHDWWQSMCRFIRGEQRDTRDCR